MTTPILRLPEHLRAGEARRRLVDQLEVLEVLTSEWDLAMVDLNVYEAQAPAEPRHLLVPELRGVVRHETRQVVRVITEGYKTRVKVERLTVATASRSPRTWDEASFFQWLADRVDPETSAPRARRIHLIVDNYGIHSAKVTVRRLAELRGRIVLHFLPPYCPDANRIERIWQDFHANVTRNHRCKTMTQLLANARRYLDAYVWRGVTGLAPLLTMAA